MPKHTRKLPKSLTHVTHFSRLLALLLILAFLASAFYAGFLFHAQYSSTLLSITPTPTAFPLH